MKTTLFIAALFLIGCSKDQIVKPVNPANFGAITINPNGKPAGGPQPVVVHDTTGKPALGPGEVK